MGHLASGRFPQERWAMDDQTNPVEGQPDEAARTREPGATVLGRGGRMSRQRKSAAVLRLLRGEDLETVSRELGVTAATVSGWRDAFLAGAVDGAHDAHRIADVAAVHARHVERWASC